jgi:type III secretion protein U
LLALPFCGPGGVFDVLGPIVKDVATMVIFTSIVMTTVHYTYDKHNWKKQHMMSKEGVKRKYKESDGDGQIKSR